MRKAKNTQYEARGMGGRLVPVDENGADVDADDQPDNTEDAD